MKIVFVTNDYDTQVSVPKKEAFQQLSIPEAELHVIPFDLARLVLPIRTTPCVFIEFDELTGDFPLENLDRIIQLVKEANLPTTQGSGE